LTVGSALALWLLAEVMSSAPPSFALVTAAAAQKTQAPLNTLKAIGAALQQCWVPPPLNRARPGMQITVRMSFKRNGELLGPPNITFQSVGASEDERLAYRMAVTEMLTRCMPLPFTDSLGNAVAGRPFTMRFIDRRPHPPSQSA